MYLFTFLLNSNKICYNRLCKLLIAENMMKKDLREAASVMQNM